MQLSIAKEILDAEVLTGETDRQLSEIELLSACGSDLMSDVLAFVKHQGMLLTGLVNPQVVRTAEMMDICAICFVRGKKPSDDIIQLAKQRNLILLTTDCPLYIACGKLYKNGLICKGE